MPSLAVVGEWIEFDGEAVARLKPHAKPGELQQFVDYLNACQRAAEALEAIAEDLVPALTKLGHIEE